MPTWAELATRIGTRRLVWLMNIYAPYVGAGIRVVAESDLSITSEMRLRHWNRNFVGTHFGGSLYAMCDPFFALILAGQLGAGYLVLDKGATIHFKKLGRGTVRATFTIPSEEVDAIRRAVDRDGRLEPKFTARVLDDAGEVVAEVEKIVYVRKKRGAAWEKAFG